MDQKTILARRMARLRSLQALFQMEASGAGVEKVARDFDSDLLSCGEGGAEMAAADSEYFRALIDAALGQQKRIDQITNAALKEGWPIDRIDPTLRALFRSAGAELIMGSAPPRVTIDEFVEIAKAFYPDGKAAGFVNGVLDHMARSLSPAAFPATGPDAPH